MDPFERDIRQLVREPVQSEVPESLRRQIDGVPFESAPQSRFRLPTTLVAAAALSAILVAVLGSVVVLGPTFRNASAPGIGSGTPLAIFVDPTPGPKDGCANVRLVPVRMSVFGTNVIFTSTLDGDLIVLYWPSGFSAEMVDGRARLVDSAGRVVAGEGDVLSELGGMSSGERVFHVCSIGTTYY